MGSSKVQKVYLNEIFISIFKLSLKDLGTEKSIQRLHLSSPR
jgi:hypothetical protein